ncbi:hypothetical protein BABINDRAFT_170642 [Babjeviella inositovora NRRL Y-12698]|uniref:Decapping nuclease n=1 Tax=Babjeviella inositovora NRRL Y-12698 TaxID=984486 RepID=A0A1E3QWQ7_9ASCO|nr:uncharacterized protein BABINDRAFT_170642 [Babjeviella inositovora NRRL Y-12698]ODQ82115.1 hypothetical protein BABINDRAFT_170642 [Babjeviella inositovora NRRL Y-12698]
MSKILPLDARAATTALKQPKELTAYARDGAGNFVFDKAVVDAEHLSYYYFPDSQVDANIDLSGGFKHFKKIDEETQVRGDFHSFLHALMLSERAARKKTAGQVFTFRGNMTKLLTLPYFDRDALDFYVVPFDGQLFIVNNVAKEMARRQLQQEDEMTRKLQFSGYKFEAVTTLRQPWAATPRAVIEKRYKEPVSNYEQYLAVVSTGIGKIRTVLGGELDCVWDYKPDASSYKTDDPLEHYVELKTLKVIQSPGQVANFERKLFKTWAQCFLMGVRKVVYGFRDESLVLKSVEQYSTEEIPLLIKNNPLADGTVSRKVNCMEALKWYGAALEFITSTVKADGRGLWVLSFNTETRKLELVESEDEEEIARVRGEVISEDFAQWRAELAA